LREVGVSFWHEKRWHYSCDSVLFDVWVRSSKRAAIAGPNPQPKRVETSAKSQLHGRWEGVQVIKSEMPRVVADVVVTITDAKGELNGQAMFYGRSRQGKGKWRPADNFGGPMLSPHVEGKVLTFKVLLRPNGGAEQTMDYKMKLIGPNQAIFDYVEATATDMSAK
jgi:hypothetical protein